MTIFKLRKRKKISLLLVYVPSLKHGIRHFHVEVVQKQERKVQKRVMQVKVVVLLIKPFFFFLTFTLPFASLDLKVPDKSGNTLSKAVQQMTHDDTVCVPC